MTILTRGELVPLKTRLKCKPCRKFYEDDNTVFICEKCGGNLRQITVHLLKIYPANKDEIYPTTSKEFVTDVQKILSSYLDNIHIFD